MNRVAVAPRTALTPARYDLETLEAAFDRAAIVAAVRRACIDHYHKRFVQADPVHLTFRNGDCHVKSGYLAGGKTYTIKIATGFYGNTDVGLPNASGMVLVSSQTSGLPIAMFEDRGMLTAWRTAAAAIIAILAGGLEEPLNVAIVGTGMQAELIARWLPESCSIASQRLWGRNADKAKALAVSLGNGTVAHGDLESLCRSANVIVTATPSEKPLIYADWIATGTHVVALGADNPGKVEIDPALFVKCDMIIVDDLIQCVDHGDFGGAVRAGLVRAEAAITLGEMIARVPPPRRTAASITIVDLTGLAAQDDAIARLFLERLAADTAVSIDQSLAVGQRRDQDVDVLGSVTD